MARLYELIKRIIDLPLAIVVLAVVSPVFIITMGVIKISRHDADIFYPCKRLGKKGRHIVIYKFRTMCPTADSCLMEILSSNQKLKREWETYRKLKNDPRVTTLGVFLRRWSIDELPQLFSVIIGDLSLIGPRPYDCGDMNSPTFRQYAKKILSVRPGITGLWQVSGRSKLSYGERVLIDVSYCDNLSLLMDMKIFAKTIIGLLSPSGAY